MSQNGQTHFKNLWWLMLEVFLEKFVLNISLVAYFINNIDF